MEKQKITKSLQCLALVAFAVMALASSSNKEAVNSVNSFIDGWEASGARGAPSYEPVDSVIDQSIDYMAMDSPVE